MYPVQINNSPQFITDSLTNGVLCSFHRRTSRTTLARWACGTTSIIHVQLMRDLYRAGLLAKQQCEYLINLMAATPVGKMIPRCEALAENTDEILRAGNVCLNVS